VSTSKITAAAPSHAAGSVDVTVTTPGGTSPATVSDLYAYGPPSISGFNPTSGITGSTVTLTGTGFAPGASVSFGSVAAPKPTLLSGTQMKVTVPDGAAVSKISVTDSQGTGTSASAFTPTVSITGFSPKSGPAGTVVTIDGLGFNASSRVRFSGVTAASVTHVSSTQLMATVPTGATSGRIMVINTAAPLGTVRSAGSFTISPGAGGHTAQ
jgi:hypothetical protein